MLEFLWNNAATGVIALALLVAVLSIVKGMLKRAARGQCASCDGCDKNGGCHCGARADEKTGQEDAAASAPHGSTGRC